MQLVQFVVLVLLALQSAFAGYAALVVSTADGQPSGGNMGLIILVSLGISGALIWMPGGLFRDHVRRALLLGAVAWLVVLEVVPARMEEVMRDAQDPVQVLLAIGPGLLPFLQPTVCIELALWNIIALAAFEVFRRYPLSGASETVHEFQAASAVPPQCIEQLERLAALRRDGLLTEQEYENEKRRILEQ